MSKPDIPTVTLVASTMTPREGEMHLIGGVDTGATTSLLSEEKARELGVKFTSSTSDLYDVEGR